MYFGHKTFGGCTKNERKMFKRTYRKTQRQKNRMTTIAELMDFEDGLHLDRVEAEWKAEEARLDQEYFDYLDWDDLILLYGHYGIELN